MRRYILVGLLFAAGCAPQLQQARPFSSTWPGSTPLSENAPTVSIQPIKVEASLTHPTTVEGEGIPTPAVLTALFIKHLHAAGVNAVLEQAQEATAPYALGCSVPRLGYTQKTGYPEQFDYQAELVCTLTETQGQKMVWKRSLQQRYETGTLLNMFNVPEQPNIHDRIIYTECIVPLWDAMASSVRTALISRPPAMESVQAANSP